MDVPKGTQFQIKYTMYIWRPMTEKVISAKQRLRHSYQIY